jgi:hypothetical protein
MADDLMFADVIDFLSADDMDVPARPSMSPPRWVPGAAGRFRLAAGVG